MSVAVPDITEMNDLILHKVYVDTFNTTKNHVVSDKTMDISFLNRLFSGDKITLVIKKASFDGIRDEQTDSIDKIIELVLYADNLDVNYFKRNFRILCKSLNKFPDKDIVEHCIDYINNNIAIEKYKNINDILCTISLSRYLSHKEVRPGAIDIQLLYTKIQSVVTDERIKDNFNKNRYKTSFDNINESLSNTTNEYVLRSIVSDLTKCYSRIDGKNVYHKDVIDAIERLIVKSGIDTSEAIGCINTMKFWNQNKHNINDNAINDELKNTLEKLKSTF